MKRGPQCDTLLEKGEAAWDKLDPIPYWNCRECYAQGYKKGYLAAQRKARAERDRGKK